MGKAGKNWRLRHDKLTRLDTRNSSKWETLGERKRAVLQVCRWAQSKRQFKNMVEHMGPNGANRPGSFKANLRHLVDFMEIGPLDSNYDDELMALYNRLPEQPPRGFKVAMNNSKTFELQASFAKSPVYIALMKGESGQPVINVA